MSTDEIRTAPDGREVRIAEVPGDPGHPAPLYRAVFADDPDWYRSSYGATADEAVTRLPEGHGQ